MNFKFKIFLHFEVISLLEILTEFKSYASVSNTVYVAFVEAF